MRKLLCALALLCCMGAGYVGITVSNTVTLVLSCTPTSGTAPLAVFCDMTSSTSTQTSLPFHEIDYICDFGDSSGGATWDQGILPGVSSKNTGYGAYQAHVFTAATGSPYTITCTGRYGSITNSKTASITVAASNTTWTGAATLCVRQTSGGSFTGCPAGADQATDNDFDHVINTTALNGTTYKRILFECDGSYAASTPGIISTTGPGYVGAYPAACPARAKPIITSGSGINILHFGNSTNFTFGDWRVEGLDFNGVTPGGDSSVFYAKGAAANISILGNTIRNTTNGFNLSSVELDAINVSSQLAAVWNGWAIVGNSFTTDSYGFLGMLNSSAIMGNLVSGQAQEHAMRLVQGVKTNWSFNTLTGTNSGSALTIRGVAWDIVNRSGGHPNQYTVPANTYSSYHVVYGNRLTASLLGNVFTFVSPNGTELPHFRACLLDSNWLTTTSGGGLPLTTVCGDGTIRNNLITNANTADLRNFEFQPTVDQTYTAYYHYNNSVYSGLSSSGVQFSIADANGSTTAYQITSCNNLGVAPSNTTSNTAPTVDFTSGTATFSTCSSKNSTKAQIQGTSPLTTTPPTTAAGWQPAAVTYPVDAGASVPVWRDFNGALRTGTYDYGAVLP